MIVFKQRAGTKFQNCDFIPGRNPACANYKTKGLNYIDKNNLMWLPQCFLIFFYNQMKQ
jgi:hypothetical protein